MRFRGEVRNEIIRSTYFTFTKPSRVNTAAGSCFSSISAFVLTWAQLDRGKDRNELWQKCLQNVVSDIVRSVRPTPIMS